jgi:hypothetical protein
MKEITPPKKGHFPEIDDTVFTLLSREMKDWSKLYCIVLVARTLAPSFSQNLVLDCRCNPRVILICI